MSGTVDAGRAPDDLGPVPSGRWKPEEGAAGGALGVLAALDFWRVMMDSPVALCLVSADGRVLEANESMCDFMGRDLESLKALSWVDVTHPDDAPWDRAQLDEIAAGHRDRYQHTKRFLFVDGTVRHGELAVTAVRNAEGGVDCFIAQVMDVTSRVVAQDAAAFATAQFRRLAEASSDVVTVVDRDGRIEWVSPSVTAVLGWTVADYTGRSILEVLHPDDLAMTAEVIARADAGAPTVRIRHRSERVDGSYCWLDSVVIVARDDAGQATHAAVTSRDVNDEVEAQQRLEVSEHRYRLLAENASDVVFERTVDARLTWVSESVTRVLGLDPGRILGRDLLAFVDPADLVLIDAHVARVAGGSPSSVQVRVGFPGRMRWIDVRERPVLDDVGRVVSVVGGLHDVDERTRAELALQASEESFRLLAENASDVVFRLRRNLVDWISPSVVDVLGHDPADLLGSDLLDLVHAEDRDRVAGARAARVPGLTSRVRYRMRRGDGSYRWFETCAKVSADPATGVRTTVAALRDVHDEVIALATVEQARDRQHAILDSFLDPWVRLASVRDESGRIVDFDYLDANRAACQANGLTLEQMVGQTLLTLFPEHGPSGWFDAYAAVVESGEPLAVDDIPFEHPGAEMQWFDNRAVKVGDGLSFTWRDVTDRYLARDTLQDLAHHDTLTGLPNRLDLLERLPLRLNRAHPGSALAVLFCDVDKFKLVNDQYGHDVGDDVLREVARRMTATVRSNDYVARLGGDEFVILLDRVRDIQQAASVAEKIREAVLAPNPVGRCTARATLSIGVALALNGDDAQRVLTAADRALYRAKDAGRNRVHLAEASPGEHRDGDRSTRGDQYGPG